MNKSYYYWIFILVVISLFHAHLWINAQILPSYITLDNIKNLIMIIGIIIGMIFTYKTFYKERLKFPKLDTQLSLDEQKLDDNNRLIHVQLKIKNIGSILFKSDDVEIRLRQILPINNKMSNALKSDPNSVFDSKQYILWPMLFQREWKDEDDKIEIEPGECDHLIADFIIPIEIKTIQIYCYVNNPKKKRIGWPIETIYHIQEKEDN